MNKNKLKNSGFPGMNARIPLFNMVQHWRKKKSENDKGGSFNVELYLAVCEAKQNQS